MQETTKENIPTTITDARISNKFSTFSNLFEVYLYMEDKDLKKTLTSMLLKVGESLLSDIRSEGE